MTKPGPEAILRAWRAAEHESPAATGVSPARGRALAATAVLGAVAAALSLESPDSLGNLLRAGRAGGLMDDQRGSHMQSVTTIIGAATVAIPLALSANASAQQGAAVQWRVEDGGNGHWYAIGEPTQRHVDAVAAATASGGLLTSLEAQQEQDWILVLGGFPEGNQGAWIGLIEAPSGWGWMSGAPLGGNTWLPGNPCGPCDEPVGMLFRNSQWGTGLADTALVACCTPYPRPIIEWSADCNNDNIVDYGQCIDGSLIDANSNNTPDCCENNLPCIDGNAAVQWRIDVGGNGHWYAIKTWNQKTSWTTAKLYAESIGGHLASITSANEDVWTTQLTMEWPAAWFGLSGPWIGATATCVCLDGNECFSWVTGEPFEYTRWHPGNPDNVTYAGAEGLVGVLLWEPNWTRGWQDASQGNEAWYGDVRSAMIEWSADCNNDGIVDYGQILQGQLADADANGIPDLCEVPTCADADLNPNGAVDGADLGAMLAFWGPLSPAFPRADINGDGTVNGADLGILLSVWGPCGG